MKFSGKLKRARKDKNMNQDALAKAIGVSKRTVQNYETADMHPKKREIYYKLAEVLDVDVNYLLTEDEELIIGAYEKGGMKAMRDMNELVQSVCGLFAGGTLPEGDMDAAMQAISEAYFAIKQENKKYAPGKYKN